MGNCRGPGLRPKVHDVKFKSRFLAGKTRLFEAVLEPPDGDVFRIQGGNVLGGQVEAETIRSMLQNAASDDFVHRAEESIDEMVRGDAGIVDGDPNVGRASG